MTNKIVWRLKEQPSSESLRELVKDGLLTKDEAREILFTSESHKERDEDSLKAEIKFLRELVDKLSQGNARAIVETIRYIEKPIYVERPWYKPYEVWCTNTQNLGYTNAVNFLNDVSTF